MLMSALTPLAELENPADFHARHIGISDADEAHMLGVIGEASRRALIESIVPRSIARSVGMDLPAPVSEAAALRELKAIASKNQLLKSFIGQGYYGTHTPLVILRNILENPAWYTAYTPYQPEISQGRLEALLNYQTMICELTGLDIANASLLDEGTAAAEAMAVAERVSKSKSKTFFVDAECHPQTIAVVKMRAEPLGWNVVVGDPETELQADAVFGAVLQYPGTHGAVRDLRGPIAALKAAGAISVVAADPLALCLLTPPGELGADIAIGSTQRFGVPMGYGAHP